MVIVLGRGPAPGIGPTSGAPCCKIITQNCNKPEAVHTLTQVSPLVGFALADNADEWPLKVQHEQPNSLETVCNGTIGTIDHTSKDCERVISQ